MIIYIRNQDGLVKQVIDNFESVIWIDRYYTQSECFLVANYDSPDFVMGNFVSYEDSDHVLVIISKVVTSDINGLRVKLQAVDLGYWLDQRVVFKTMNLTGNLQTVLTNVFNTHLINPSDGNRKISNIAFIHSSSKVISSLKIDYQITGSTLYEILETLCSVMGFGYKTIWSDINRRFEIHLIDGQDRSNSQSVRLHNPVIFSRNLGNLKSSESVFDIGNYKNLAYVAGEGEGTNRVVETAYLESSIPKGVDRTEVYVDARDLSRDIDDMTIPMNTYKGHLVLRGKEKLAPHQNILTFDGEIESVNMMVIDRDFYLGDLVEYMDYGLSERVRITEKISSMDNQQGFVVIPTFMKEDL